MKRLLILFLLIPTLSWGGWWLVSVQSVTASGGGSVAYRSFTSGVDDQGVTTTISLPSSVDDGDMLIAVLTHDEGGNTISAPAGWSSLGSIANGGSNSQWAFYKEASSEGSDYDFTASSAAGVAGHIVAFSKASGSWKTPVATTSQLDSTSITTASATVSTGDLLLVSFGNDQVGTVSTAPASNITLIGQQDDSVSQVSYYSTDTGTVTKTLEWAATEDLTSFAIVVGLQ